MPKAIIEILADDKTKAGFRSVRKNLSSTSKAFRSFAATAGIAGGVLSARSMLMAADGVNALKIRVKTATKETGDFDFAWRRLSETALRTGADLETTIATFQDLARARHELGATNAEVLEITETVQQLGVIGGSSTEAMRFGMRQFNQAMSSSVFRAEEFNSLVENMPELVSRIAKGMDTTTGALRQTVLQGKLLSKDVFDVLQKQAPGIAKDFDEIPATLGRATETFTTAFKTYLSDLDESIGLTETLAENLNDISASIAPSIDDMAGQFAAMTVQLKDMDKAEAALLDRIGEIVKRRGEFAPGHLYTVLANLQEDIRDVDEERMEIAEKLLKFKKGMVAATKEEVSATTNALSADDKKLLEAQQGKFDKLTDAALTAEGADIELENRRHARALAGIQKDLTLFQDKNLLTKELEDQFMVARVDAAEVHSLKLLAIQKKTMDKSSAMDKLSNQAKIMMTLASSSQLLGAVGGSSKRLFKVQKAFALAQATVGLPPAVIDSFKNAGGYPWGLIPAAAMAATGLKQIQAIKSAKFGGGGRVPSIGGGGGAGPVPSISTPLPGSLLPDARTPSGREINIYIAGSVITENQVGEIAIDALEEYFTADRIIIQANSSQAKEIYPDG